MAERIAIARQEARARGVDLEQRADAIVLELEEPIGVVEGFGRGLSTRGAIFGSAVIGLVANLV
jgi:hypothetical protein